MTKLLIGVTGSLSVFTLANYLVQIRQHFSEIKIIMSHTATKMIPKGSFSMFCDGIYDSEFPLCKENMIHMEFARWADIFIVLPASGHVLAQTAHGMADTLISATILAYRKKVIFFPNMNSAMWNNRALQRNIALVEEDHTIIYPVEKPAFEYASRQVEMNHVLPSVESVLSILKSQEELALEIVSK